MSEINVSNIELINKYKELGSIRQVAKLFGFSATSMREHFIKHNLEYQKKIIYTFDQDFFAKNTAETFYVAGLLAADGSIYDGISKNGSKSYNVSISLKEGDILHLEKIKTLLGSDHKLYRRLAENSKRNPKHKDSVSYMLMVSSPKYINDLKRFNISRNKSLVYDMPDWLQEHPLVKFFLLGYFDGDGSIYLVTKHNKTPQIRLHIRGTRSFLTNFHRLLYHKCDLKTKHKVINKESGIYSLQYVGNPQVYRIMSYLYQDVPIYLDRKHDRYLKLVDIIASKHGLLSESS